MESKPPKPLTLRRIRCVRQKKEEKSEGLEKDSSEPTVLDELTAMTSKCDKNKKGAHES